MEELCFKKSQWDKDEDLTKTDFKTMTISKNMYASRNQILSFYMKPERSENNRKHTFFYTHVEIKLVLCQEINRGSLTQELIRRVTTSNFLPWKYIKVVPATKDNIRLNTIAAKTKLF